MDGLMVLFEITQVFTNWNVDGLMVLFEIDHTGVYKLKCAWDESTLR